MLEQTNLTENDTIYVLGDVVDRGPQRVCLITKPTASFPL
jgi:hypothetical protein